MTADWNVKLMEDEVVRGVAVSSVAC